MLKNQILVASSRAGPDALPDAGGQRVTYLVARHCYIVQRDVDADALPGASITSMNKTKGRTGAHARAKLQPPPTPAELEAARREVAQVEGRLAELAAGHPSVKTWKGRLRAAQAIIARAPRG